MALRICYLIFPSRQWKQNDLLRNVWSCQNPAEQGPTSGIQTIANMGSEKAILLLLEADKLMLIRAESDVQGFSLTFSIPTVW
jgi:hypothetical protein